MTVCQRLLDAVLSDLYRSLSKGKLSATRAQDSACWCIFPYIHVLQDGGQYMNLNKVSQSFTEMTRKLQNSVPGFCWSANYSTGIFITRAMCLDIALEMFTETLITCFTA